VQSTNRAKHPSVLPHYLPPTVVLAQPGRKNKQKLDLSSSANTKLTQMNIGARAQTPSLNKYAKIETNNTIILSFHEWLWKKKTDWMKVFENRVPKRIFGHNRDETMKGLKINAK
jgi:hypothetical protein